jgi:hypothetical protein
MGETGFLSRSPLTAIAFVTLSVVLLFASSATRGAAKEIISEHKHHREGKGVASPVFRPGDDDHHQPHGQQEGVAGDSHRLSKRGAASSNSKYDRVGRGSRLRQISELKSPDDVKKFAHVLHGLEELLKSTELK